MSASAEVATLARHDVSHLEEALARFSVLRQRMPTLDQVNALEALRRVTRKIPPAAQLVHNWLMRPQRAQGLEQIV